MEIHRVSAYHDVEHALRITDLKQSLYDEGKILMDKVLVTSTAMSTDSDAPSRASCSARTFSACMKMRSSPDYSARHWTSFSPNRRWTSRSWATASWFISHCPSRASIASTAPSRRQTPAPAADPTGPSRNHWSVQGRSGTHFQEIREAIDEFRERFFLPSRAGGWRCWSNTARNPERRGLPRDILTILLMHDAELSMPNELMVREVAFFYLAASHTSVHTLVHATNELFNWCERRPNTG